MPDILKRLFFATRPMFFPASALPIVVGTAWGGPPWDVAAFFLALLAMICLHAAANVLNDVGDELNGCDRANFDRIAPFTGGSRFIQDGLLSVRQMSLWGCALLAIAAVLGVVLILSKGVVVLELGLFGAALASAYSFRPFALASRGWGELAVGIAFGLPVAAAGWLQGGVVTLPLILSAMAVGCWSAAILIVNEVPDLSADESVGKRTLVVRLGRQNAGKLYLAVQVFSWVMLTALVILLGLSLWLMLPVLLLAFLAVLARLRLSGERDDLVLAIRLTLAVHMLGGIWLVILAVLA